MYSDEYDKSHIGFYAQKSQSIKRPLVFTADPRNTEMINILLVYLYFTF